MSQQIHLKYEYLIYFLKEIFVTTERSMKKGFSNEIKILDPNFEKLSEELQNSWKFLLENSYDFSLIQKEYIERIHPWKEKSNAFQRVKNKQDFLNFLEKFFSTWMKLSFKRKDISRKEIKEIIEYEKPTLSLAIQKQIGVYKNLSIFKNDLFQLTAHLKLKEYKTETHSLTIIFSFWFENLKDSWREDLGVINENYKNSITTYNLIKKLKSLDYQENTLYFENQKKSNQIISIANLMTHSTFHPSNNLILEILSDNPVRLFEEFRTHLYSIEEIFQEYDKTEDFSPSSYFESLTLELQQFLLKGKDLFLRAEDILHRSESSIKKIQPALDKKTEEPKITLDQIIAFFKDALEKDKNDNTILPEEKGFRTQNQIYEEYEEKIKISKPTFYNYFEIMKIASFLIVRNKPGKGGGTQYRYREYNFESGESIGDLEEVETEEEAESLVSERIDLQRALTLYNNHYFERSIQILEQLSTSKKLQSNPDLYYPNLYYLGRSHFKKGNYEKALESFNKVYMKDQKLYNVKYSLVECYLQLQDYEKALNHANGIINEIKEIFQSNDVTLNLDHLFVNLFDPDSLVVIHPRIIEEDMFSRFSILINKSSIKINAFFSHGLQITSKTYEIINGNILSLQILYKKYLSSVYLRFEILRRTFFIKVIEHNKDEILEITEEFLKGCDYLTKDPILSKLLLFEDYKNYISYFLGLSRLFNIFESEQKILEKYSNIGKSSTYPKHYYLHKFEQYYSFTDWVNELLYEDFENRDRIFNLLSLRKFDPISKAEYYFIETYINYHYLIDKRIKYEEELNDNLDLNNINNLEKIFQLHDEFHGTWFGSNHPIFFIEMAQKAYDYCKGHNLEFLIIKTKDILKNTQEKYKRIENLRLERRNKIINRKLEVLSKVYNEIEESITLSFQMKPKEGFIYFIDNRLKRELERTLQEKIGNLTFNIHLFNPDLNFDVMQELKDMLLSRESVIKRTRAFFLVKLDTEENKADNSIILKLIHYRDLEKEKSGFGENLDKINWLIYNAINLNLNSFTIKIDLANRERYRTYFEKDFPSEYKNSFFKFKIIENTDSNEFTIQIKKF